MDAFRDLLKQGEKLLGEVLIFTRNAEHSLSFIEQERMRLEAERVQLQEERLLCGRDLENTSLQLLAREKENARLCHELAEQQARQQARELSSTTDIRQQLQHMEKRLCATEEELRLTRDVLNGERQRRNRAIELIRPSAGAGEPVSINQALRAELRG